MTIQPESPTRSRYTAKPWRRPVYWTVTDTHTGDIIAYVVNENFAHTVADWLNETATPLDEDNFNVFPTEPDDGYVCCPECGNTNFIEVPRHTTKGLTYFLQCDNDDCGVVIIQ